MNNSIKAAVNIEEEAIWLSKAVILLDKYGFIQTYEEEEEGHCAHLLALARHHAQNIMKLATEIKDEVD